MSHIGEHHAVPHDPDAQFVGAPFESNRSDHLSKLGVHLLDDCMYTRASADLSAPPTLILRIEAHLIIIIVWEQTSSIAA